MYGSLKLPPVGFVRVCLSGFVLVGSTFSRSHAPTKDMGDSTAYFVTSFGILALQATYWDKYVAAFDWFGSASVSSCGALVEGCPCLSVADLFGSCLACWGYKKTIETQKGQQRYWLESLFVSTVIQFGGTTLTAVTLGQTPSWLSSATAWPSLFLMWWLTFFSPFELWPSLMGSKVFQLFINVR